VEDAAAQIIQNTVLPENVNGDGHYNVQGVPFTAKNLAKAMKKINPDCKVDFIPDGEMQRLLEEHKWPEQENVSFKVQMNMLEETVRSAKTL
jgi:hypothetical protein